MRYRTKITVVTGGKTYKPGTVLPEDISREDLSFLKSKGFVELADMAPAADECEDAKNEGEPDRFKSPEEIRKIRSKKEVSVYAASIGLDLGEDYEGKALKDLQEEVINFQEEKGEW